MIIQPGQQIYDLSQRMQFRQPRSLGIDWWLAGGIPKSNCLAAFQPIGAASLAASKVNLVSPGINDAAKVVNDPTFDTSYGWHMNDTSDQYLRVGSGALVTAVPLTFACLFNVPYKFSGFTAMCVARDNTEVEGWDMEINVPLGTKILAVAWKSGAAYASSTAQYTENTWHTSAAVYSANNARAAYLNGGSKGTNATSKVVSGNVNITIIGALHDGTNFFGKLLGKIGACAFYNTPLNDAQVMALHTAMMALVA